MRVACAMAPVFAVLFLCLHSACRCYVLLREYSYVGARHRLAVSLYKASFEGYVVLSFCLLIEEERRFSVYKDIKL